MWNKVLINAKLRNIKKILLIKDYTTNYVMWQEKIVKVFMRGKILIMFFVDFSCSSQVEKVTPSNDQNKWPIWSLIIYLYIYLCGIYKYNLVFSIRGHP